MPKLHGKRIFALDTNVLLHDPTALFRFEEHDVFIPMTVLEELDEKKQGTSEVARNARQASRFLNELIERNDHHGIEDGVPLAQPDGVRLAGTRPPIAACCPDCSGTATTDLPAFCPPRMAMCRPSIVASS